MDALDKYYDVFESMPISAINRVYPRIQITYQSGLQQSIYKKCTAKSNTKIIRHRPYWPFIFQVM